MKYFYVTASSVDIFNLASSIQLFAFDSFQGKFIIENINLIWDGSQYIYTMLVKATI